MAWLGAWGPVVSVERRESDNLPGKGICSETEIRDMENVYVCSAKLDGCVMQQNGVTCRSQQGDPECKNAQLFPRYLVHVAINIPKGLAGGAQSTESAHRSKSPRPLLGPACEAHFGGSRPPWQHGAGARSPGGLQGRLGTCQVLEV